MAVTFEIATDPPVWACTTNVPAPSTVAPSIVTPSTRLPAPLPSMNWNTANGESIAVNPDTRIVAPEIAESRASNHSAPTPKFHDVAGHGRALAAVDRDAVGQVRLHHRVVS